MQLNPHSQSVNFSDTNTISVPYSEYYHPSTVTVATNSDNDKAQTASQQNNDTYAFVGVN
jgi:hypothetical protein